MTWEERINQHNQEVFQLLDVDHSAYGCVGSHVFGYTGSCNCNAQQRRDALYLAQIAVRDGELSALKSALEKVKPQYEALRKTIKCFFAYPGEKTILFGNGVDFDKTARCGISLELIFNNGSLHCKLPSIMLGSKIAGNDRQKADKLLLALSRFLRDAEVRCLKHPRHKTI